MAKKSAPKRWDAVGWGFWLIVFCIAIGPCLYLAWKITYEGTNSSVRIAIGAVSAAVGAGVVSWLVNTVLQYRDNRRRKQERKKAKKGK